MLNSDKMHNLLSAGGTDNDGYQRGDGFTVFSTVRIIVGRMLLQANSHRASWNGATKIFRQLKKNEWKRCYLPKKV